MSDQIVDGSIGPFVREAHLACRSVESPERASEFSHPREILDAAGLSGSDKRALLAAWASDACAVEGRPGLRRLPGSATCVSVDEILEALQALDRGGLH